MGDSHNKAAGKGRASATCSRFKVVGNYLYARVESVKTFATKEEAQALNRKWTKEAEAKGMRWRGRAVPADQ